jgi:hypothetical protein
VVKVKMKEIICSKCKRIVGVTDSDGVVLTIGDSQFFQDTNFSHSCGRAIKFRPNEPKDLSSLKGAARDILNALGKDRKVRGN